MKKFIARTVILWLGLGSVVAQAATVAAADAGMVQTATTLAGINTAIFQSSQILDIGTANILWVLGGGLVALSLVARRVSSS